MYIILYCVIFCIQKYNLFCIHGMCVSSIQYEMQWFLWLHYHFSWETVIVFGKQKSFFLEGSGAWFTLLWGLLLHILFVCLGNLAVQHVAVGQHTNIGNPLL